MSAQAVCIGLGYHGNANPGDDLPGTIQDAQTMATVAANSGFEAQTVTDAKEPLNREQILDSLRSMVENAQPGDNLLFAFSGHGGQDNGATHDPNEVDGQNEFIADSYGNPIYDNEIREILSELPAGANMTMAFDNCRSGTIADLDTAGIEGNVVCVSASLDHENSLAGESGSLFTNTLAEVMAAHPDASWQEIKAEIDARIADQGQTVQLSSTDPAMLEQPPFGVSADAEKLLPFMPLEHDCDVLDEKDLGETEDFATQDLDQVIDPAVEVANDAADSVANAGERLGVLITEAIAAEVLPNAGPSSLELAWNEIVGEDSTAVADCGGCTDGLTMM